MDKLPLDVVNYILKFDNTYVFKNGKFLKNIKKIPKKLLENRNNLIKFIPEIEIGPKYMDRIWVSVVLPLKRCNGLYKIYKLIPINDNIRIIVKIARGDYDNQQIIEEFNGFLENN